MGSGNLNHELLGFFEYESSLPPRFPDVASLPDHLDTTVELLLTRTHSKKITVMEYNSDEVMSRLREQASAVEK